MKIAVIGAGLAGLAAGYWLSKAGCEIEIFEATEKAGGRALTLRTEGTDDLVDVGTQYFHSNYALAMQLIADIGLKQNLRKIAGQTRFFDSRVEGGSFTTGHRVPYLRSGTVLQNATMLTRGLIRLAANPIDPFSVLATSKADQIRADEIVKNPFEWEYNARALIMAGALAEPCCDPISYLHLIRLMRIIVMSDYLTLDGGITSLHEALAENLTIHYNAPIKSLALDGDVTKGVVTDDGKAHDADHVVIATTPHAATSIIPESWKPEIRFLESIDQPPAIVATFFLDGVLENNVWSYVFRQAEDRLVSFCVDAAVKNPAMVSGKNSILQAWICSPASQKAMKIDDPKLQNDVLRELEQQFPEISKKVVRSHIHKVENAIPQMPVGHNKAANEFLASADARCNVDFCGDYLSGGYMECALWSAKRVVDRITNHT